MLPAMRPCLIIILQQAIATLRRHLRVLPALLLLGLASIAQAEPPEVTVVRSQVDGRAQFDVRVDAVARTSLARAWQVLTAYDRLADFVPNLVSSVELPLAGAAPGEHLVEQHGYGKFLFFKQPVDLVLRVQEQAMSSIDMSLQSGNMRKYHARWELQELPARQAPDAAPGPQVQLRYVGLLAPDFYVPGLLGSTLMRRDLAAMIAAVVREMEKPEKTENPEKPEKAE